MQLLQLILSVSKRQNNNMSLKENKNVTFNALSAVTFYFFLFGLGGRGWRGAFDDLILHIFLLVYKKFPPMILQKKIFKYFTLKKERLEKIHYVKKI
jgi:hypothetical protein